MEKGFYLLAMFLIIATFVGIIKNDVRIIQTGVCIWAVVYAIS